MELGLERNGRETGRTCHPTGGAYKRGVSLFVLHIKKCMGILKRLSIVSFHRVTTLLRLKINVKLRFCGFCAHYIMCSNTCSNSQRKSHKIAKNLHFEPQKLYPEYTSTDIIFPLQYSHTFIYISKKRRDALLVWALTTYSASSL